MEHEKKPRATPEETTLHFIEWKVKWQRGQQEVSSRNHYYEWMNWLDEFNILRNQKERMENAEYNCKLYESYFKENGGRRSFTDWLHDKGKALK